MNAQSIDGNALFYNRLLSRPFLQSALDDLERRERSEQSRTIDHDGLLRRAALRCRDYLLDEAARAGSILKGRAEATPERCKYAFNTHTLLFRLISMAWGALIERDRLELPHQSRTLRELIESASDAPWPLIDEFVKHELLPTISGDEDLIGLSIHTPGHMYVGVRFAKLLREHFSHLPIVVGGTFLTTYANRWRAFGPVFDAVDYVVVHDGEVALPALAQQIANGTDLSRVPNLVWRDGRELRSTPVIFSGQEDFAPTPDYTDLDLGLYFAPRPVASIPVARGCFYDCAYCNYPAVGGRRFRVDPAAAVADKVAELRARHGMESFFFSVAVLPPVLARNISEALLARNIEIRWGSGARFERQFTPELCQLMARAGCTRLDFGVESGDPEVLERMHKRLALCDYEIALGNFSGTDINRHFYFLKDFPGETLPQFANSIAFARRAAPDLCSFNFFEFQMAHDSPVFDKPADYGVQLTRSAPDGEINIQNEFDDPHQSSALADAKRQALHQLTRDLRPLYASDGRTFNHRGFLPDFVLQLALPNRGAVPFSPPDAPRWRLRSSVKITDLGRATVAGTGAADYRFLRDRETGGFLLANDAGLRYLLGGDVHHGELLDGGRDPIRRELFEVFRSNELLEAIA